MDKLTGKQGLHMLLRDGEVPMSERNGPEWVKQFLALDDKPPTGGEL